MPEAKEWQTEIAEYFRGDHEAYLKTHTIRLFYRGMDLDYTTKDGRHHLHITGDGEKLTIREEGEESAYLYEELAEHINYLLLDGSYPVVDRGGKRDTEEKKGRQEQPENNPFVEEGAESSFPHAINFKGNPKTGEGKGMAQDGQLSFFDIGTQDNYEDIIGTDTDAMLDGQGMPEAGIMQDGETEPTKESVIGGEMIEQPQGIPEPIPIPTNLPHHRNYHFSEDHHLYDGGAKTKCQNNITAIRLWKELQSQNRMATEEEQITLAKFVGWGGLANALTPGKGGWETQYQEIKDLLTDEEFQAAQENTLTAYYTEQGIIRHIYNALGQFGFRSGNILEIILQRLIQGYEKLKGTPLQGMLAFAG